jgi:O-antigen/teichoic acid export membrane protein
LACPFVLRTVVRYVLGVDFLGLDSLFAAIISVLSLTELGFGSAIVCHLYRPVAENDVKTVNAILNFYRKAYRIIGSAILVMGTALIPFLPYLIKESYPAQIVLWKVYSVFLLNTVVSYFLFAYLSPLITVYQREDINSNINSVITILGTGCKLGLLFLTKNYYFYLLTVPLFTIAGNLAVAYQVKKNFPQYRCEGKIPVEIIRELKKLVTGTFIQRACSLTRNSLDSICISAFLGLSATAVYGNYFCISASLTQFVAVIAAAFAGGVGNHVATKSKEENFEELQKLDFLYLLVSGWCTVCLFCLYQPFMTLWMGKKSLLDMTSVALFCLYFYLLKLGDVRYLYSTANGLWWKMKWRAIGETVGNLVLNIALGSLFGIHGIIAATAISLFLFNCLWSTQILFTEYFGKKLLAQHFRAQFIYSLVTCSALLLTYRLCCLFRSPDLLLVLVYRGVLCVIVPGLLYWAVYHRTRITQESLALIKG